MIEIWEPLSTEVVIIVGSSIAPFEGVGTAGTAQSNLVEVLRDAVAVVDDVVDEAVLLNNQCIPVNGNYRTPML